MRVDVLRDPVVFLERTARLLADEARNNLILGLAQESSTTPDLFDGILMFVVVDDAGDTVSAALITPPHNLVVADTESGDAVGALVAAVLDSGIYIPGAVGVRPSVDLFVDAWSGATGKRFVVEIEHGVFMLESVATVPKVEGTARIGVIDDLDMVLEWSKAFMAEALPGDDFDTEQLQAQVHKMLAAGGETGIWLWERAGAVVSMSGHGGPTGSGIRIRMVYTPPGLRGNGYATSLVAHQSQRLLDSGYDVCTLFTDLSNPTSNAIYKRIGYKQVAESAQFRLLA